ncbi:MAG: DUF342 domain-containing protein [Ignavibacteriales bacterium]|nr:DUF342 domain-containing protein [Ignavibacteriales bacterium]
MSTQTDQIETDQNLVELHVQPLNDELTEKVLTAFNGLKVYLTRINANHEDLPIVEKSTPLFSFVVEDEKDEKTSKNKIIEISPDFHDNRSNIEQSGKNYVALVDGIFVIENDRPKIIPVDLHGSGDVKVSENSMNVYVDIYPSIGENPIPSLDDIVEKILKLNVTAEIDKELLAQKLSEVENDKIRILNLCVAKGQLPVNGINGRLENCTNNKEKLENFDFDEFHKVNPVISVKTDDTIAIVHPPTKGEKGINVFGKTVEPIPGKEYVIKLGPYTKYSEVNENNIIATVDGFVNLNDSSISITDTFTVKGDIDFKSGNIVSKGSLKVVGNVNNDFTLKLTKDIEIGGYVGDAVIESGKNITIRGGFLGKGKGVIKAEGDVELKFVENQKVFTRGSLTIGKEALNAQLFVKNSILTKGSAVIVGGHAIAGDSIQIYNLGNASESETIVEVGFDYIKRNSIVDNKEKMNSLRKTLEEVDKNILELAQMKRMNTVQEKVKLLAAEHKRLAAEN